MAKGIFVHRADSKYDDLLEEQYQFPKRYLNRAKQFENDWIIYYEPRRGGGRLGYTAIAKIAAIVPDPNKADMFIAQISPPTFLPFEEFVPYKSSAGFLESELEKPDGSLNGGKIQWAVRPISNADFLSIVSKGFPEDRDLLPRKDLDEEELPPIAGFADEKAEFLYDFERDRVETTILRIPRKSVFRRLVLEAYNSRCAITGLRIINGGGRAEVEAAHIKPVAANGPDSLHNGIALSGTVHWMFDRGLISLTDDLDILISRQVNDQESVHGLINATGKAVAPENSNHRPHPNYLDWHRQNCFKA